MAELECQKCGQAEWARQMLRAQGELLDKLNDILDLLRDIKELLQEA